MLISHRHRFIFVHVPKNAGMSITHVLEPYADVAPRPPHRRLLSHLPLPEDPWKASFGRHASARWARAKLPAAVFDSYLKFAVVRNPYERAVSLYHFLSQQAEHHRHRRVKPLSFYGFLRHLRKVRAVRDETQFRCVGDRSGALLIDRALRFETLDGDFAALCRELDLPAGLALPVHNTSAHADAMAYYRDPDTCALASDLFGVDCLRLGYDDVQAEVQHAGRRTYGLTTPTMAASA